MARSRSRSTNKKTKNKFLIDPRIKSLTYSCGIKDAREIFKTGYIKPKLSPNYIYSIFEDGVFVYLDPHCDNNDVDFTKYWSYPIILHIDPSILYFRSDYHLTTGYMKVSYEKDELEKWLDKITFFPGNSMSSCSGNEILFDREISLNKYLYKITINEDVLKDVYGGYYSDKVAEGIVTEKYLPLVSLVDDRGGRRGLSKSANNRGKQRSRSKSRSRKRLR